MFYGCNSLKSLELSHFNISLDINKISIYINEIFYKCNSLESLDLPSINMIPKYINKSKTISSESLDISRTFYDCYSLKSLDFSNYNMYLYKNKIYMNDLFYNCYSLSTLVLPYIDISFKYLDMSRMFYNCSSLKLLNLTIFDISLGVSNIFINTNEMFYKCDSLEKLDLPSINITPEYIDMNKLYYNCSPSDTLNLTLSNNNTSISEIFYNCSSIKSLDLSYFDIYFEYINFNKEYYSCDLLNSSNLFYDEYLILSEIENNISDIATNISDISDNVSNISDNDSSLTDINKTIYYIQHNIIIYSTFYNCSLFESLDPPTINISSESIDTTRMFYNCSSLKSLDLSYYNMSWISHKIYMNDMFYNCYSLSILNLPYIDIKSEYIDMSGLFYNCTSLISLNLPHFYILSTVERLLLYGMFYNCNTLLTLDLSNFYLFSVSKFFLIYGIFNRCSSLRSLNLPSINISSEIIDLEGMFYGCKSLVSLNLNNVNISSKIKVIYMYAMFQDCNSLASIDLSNFKINSKSIDIEKLFYNCNSLKSIKLPYFDVTSIVDNISMNEMFYGCSSLESLDLSEVNIFSKVVDMEKMFYGCSGLLHLNLTNINTSYVINMKNMFSFCNSLTSLDDLSYFDISSTQDISGMFSSCSSLHSLDLSNFNISSVLNMSNIFSGCWSLTSINLPDFSTSHVEDMHNMFFNCILLESLDLSNFNNVYTLDMSKMFSNCISLKTLNLSNFKTSSVQKMDYIFSDCSSLESLDLSDLDTSTIKSMKGMFSGCNKLSSINISNFNTSSVEFMDSMFYNCYNLIYINISNFNTSNTFNMSYMFFNCSNLEYINFNDFSEGNSTNVINLFDGVTDSLTYCTNINNTETSIIMRELNRKKCVINDCSKDWKTKQRNIIFEKNICVYNCSEDDIYIYEFKNRCYKKCPEGTYLLNYNRLCLTQCPIDYPFILNDECIQECNIPLYIKEKCKMDKLSLQTKELLINKVFDEAIKDQKYIELVFDLFIEKLKFKDLSETEIDEIIEANNVIFQFTIIENQNSNNSNSNFSNIELNDCEAKLKEIHQTNESLIILKADIKREDSASKQVEYKLYNPITLAELDLSICQEDEINIYSPVDLDEYTFNLIKSLKEQGYDLFNSSDEFFNDICSPYNSTNNTDVILADRKNDFYISNISLCEESCEYKGFNIETLKVKCQCNIKTEVKSEVNFVPNKVNDDFYKVEEFSYLNIMFCYKNVFNLMKLKKNYGSLFMIFIIIIFIIVMISSFNQLQSKVTVILQILMNELYLLNTRFNKKGKKRNNINNPVKKTLNSNSPSTKRKRKKKNKTAKMSIDKIGIKKQLERASLKRKSGATYISLKDNMKNQKDLLKSKNPHQSDIEMKNNKINIKGSLISFNSSLNSIISLHKEENENNNVSLIDKILSIPKNERINYLNNTELNRLEYKNAIYIDFRTYCQTYCSLLKENHYILFIFANKKDFNIFTLKFSLFIIYLTLFYFMNALLFSNELLHKIYKDEGKFDIFYNIPHIILSTLGTRIIISLLSFLALSQSDILKLKEKNNNTEKMKKLGEKAIKCIGIKNFFFYFFGLIILLAAWYYISIFSYVYYNAQIFLVINAGISFGFSIIYPFFLYLLPAIIRIMALRLKIKCIYILNNIIIYIISKI